MNYMFKGIAKSSINMLAIPFYLGLSFYLTSIDKIILEQSFFLLFVIGVAVGSFLLFNTYIIFANLIKQRISFIAKNINILLSILFFVLGILTLTKLLT